MIEKPKLSLQSGKEKKTIDPEAVEDFGNKAPVAKLKKAKASSRKKQAVIVSPNGKTILKSFKLFKTEDKALDALTLRATIATKAIRSKTDVIRAGIIALNNLPDKEFAEILKQIPETKPGPQRLKK